MLKIDYLKKLAKYIKKITIPNNLCLMKIQHKLAKQMGYKNWQELIKEEKNQKLNPEKTQQFFCFDWENKEWEYILPNKKEILENEN